MATLNVRYSTGFIRLTVAIFFFVLGIVGVTGAQESIFSLNDNNHTVELIFGIVEIICGVLLLLGIFTVGGRQFSSMASIIVFILWLIRVVYSIFFVRLTINNNGIRFHNSFSEWILILSCELVIAAAILAMVKGSE